MAEDSIDEGFLRFRDTLRHPPDTTNLRAIGLLLDNHHQGDAILVAAQWIDDLYRTIGYRVVPFDFEEAE